MALRSIYAASGFDLRFLQGIERTDKLFNATEFFQRTTTIVVEIMVPQYGSLIMCCISDFAIVRTSAYVDIPRGRAHFTCILAKGLMLKPSRGQIK